MDTPWGAAEKVLYGNKSKTFAMVWAQNGHGFMIDPVHASNRDKERGIKYNDKYWIPGIKRK